jgi:hypothetical protein
MGREIHRIVRGGIELFREWSTVVDAYTTEEYSNLEAFRKDMLAWELEETERRFNNEFPQRIERARARGTSSRITTREMEQWDKSMEERVADGEFDDEDDE